MAITDNIELPAMNGLPRLRAEVVFEADGRTSFSILEGGDPPGYITLQADAVRLERLGMWMIEISERSKRHARG